MSATSSLKAGILIVSDTAAHDPSSDKVEPALRSVFGGNDDDDGKDSSSARGGQWQVDSVKIVADKVDDIQAAIKGWTDADERLNLIVTSGGTGFAVKDVTPEAILPLLHRQAPGLVHGMLAASLAVTPFAMMSRPVAGVRNSTVIITLPGSPQGAKENLEAVIKLLPHACMQAAGADSRQLHSHHSPMILETKTKPDVGSTTQPNDPSAPPALRHRSSPYPMISTEDALTIIFRNTPRPEPVTVPVTPSPQLTNAVLAAPVYSPVDVPAFPASIVDGYAIEAPTTERRCVVASVSSIFVLSEGRVARITTGAPLPPNSNAVVMVEDTTLLKRTTSGTEEAVIEINTSDIVPDQNVRQPGSDIKQGTLVLDGGARITRLGGEIGVLASIGLPTVSVFRKPVVGILSTGSELVAHDDGKPLARGYVRDVNRPALLTLVASWGYQVVDLGIAKDTPEALEEALRRGLSQVTHLVTTGGASMGELDLMKPVFVWQMGGHIEFGRVAVKPGKPTAFGTIELKNSEGQRQHRFLFSLPGNPASALVTAHVFLRPALDVASGMDVSAAGCPRIKVVLAERIDSEPGRTEYVRAFVEVSNDDNRSLVARTTGMQRSSRIASLSACNALIEVPKGVATIERGRTVTALIIGELGHRVGHWASRHSQNM